MHKFVRHFIMPLAMRRGWRSFCEIGASTGRSTDHLLRLPNISHKIIDPCLDANLLLKYLDDSRVTVLRGNSLDVLPKLTGICDCFIIDGDHNWYTVLNELRQINQRGLLRPGGMIFLHDVGWPYGRRDMYYQPHTIPSEYLQEYECKGIIGENQLAESGGANRHLFNAVHEGGARNGVLTAVEDFIAEHPSEYHFCRVRLQNGLGILQYRRKRSFEDIAFFLIRIKAAMYETYGLMRDLVFRFRAP